MSNTRKPLRPDQIDPETARRVEGMLGIISMTLGDFNDPPDGGPVAFVSSCTPNEKPEEPCKGCGKIHKHAGCVVAVVRTEDAEEAHFVASQLATFVDDLKPQIAERRLAAKRAEEEARRLAMTTPWHARKADA